MFGLILLSMVGMVGMAAAMGLLGSDDDAEARVDEADLEQDLPLLDATSVEAMETALAEDPLLAAAEIIPEGELLAVYEDANGFSDVQGSAEGDLIAIPEELGSDHDAIFANAGNDVVLGNSAYNPIFGGDGADLIFGLGGNDYLFGDDGDDTLVGGLGDDLIVGGIGGDVLYGGAGNDNIYDARNDLRNADRNRADVIVAGDGDDGVVIEDGVNLVSLGAGADHVTVFAESGDDPVAVITDFDPGEDALLLGVYAPGVNLANGVNAMELGYSLREVETELGKGTLVQPAGTSDIGADSLGEGASVGFALLLGVRPQDLTGANIQVVLETPETDRFAAGSVERVAELMGATRL